MTKSLHFLVLALWLCLCGVAFGQGVTTSSIVGSVTDTRGEALVAASVIAEHVPSGTKYGGLTQANGRYTLQGLRVGGPYRVTAKYVGYQEQVIENVFLSLGLATRLDFKLSDKPTATEEVVVTAIRGGVISPERTGASTNVPREVISSLPTLSIGTLPILHA